MIVTYWSFCHIQTHMTNHNNCELTKFRYLFFWKNRISHFAYVDQNPATGDLLHRLPDQRPEERRPEQWGGRLQGGHPQEVEREDGGAETKRTGKQLPFFISTQNTIYGKAL